MNDPTENRFQELTKKLEEGLNEEFCDGPNCHARLLNFRTEKVNPKKSLGTVCGFPAISHTIVDFLINIKILAGQESTVKNDLDQKMTNCKVISGHEVTPGTFSRGNCDYLMPNCWIGLKLKGNHQLFAKLKSLHYSLNSTQQLCRYLNMYQK